MTNVSKTLGLSIGVLLLGLFVLGCGGDKQVAPVPVGALQEYRDPQYGFHFQHPSGWVAGGEAGRPRIYNSLEAGQRFMDPLGAYPDGVLISVDVIKTANPAQEKAGLIAELTSSGRVVGQESAMTLGGKPAAKVPYTANFSAKVIVTGHHIFVELDTVLYDLAFSGFGDMYASHEAIFDTVAKSFTFPRAVEPGRDATLPADAFTQYDAKMFTFQYPENFNFENTARGNNDLALEPPWRAAGLLRSVHRVRCKGTDHREGRRTEQGQVPRCIHRQCHDRRATGDHAHVYSGTRRRTPCLLHGEG